MSRIGKQPITLPKGVSVNVADDNTVHVKGGLGELELKVDPDIQVNVSPDSIELKRPSDQKRHRSLHGLYRALLNNMVVGVSQGWELRQELIGVGFKAEVKKDFLHLTLGFSHDVIIQLPPEVKAEILQERRGSPVLVLKSPDRQLVGMVAAKIRTLRPPEPYLGKGIRFVGEQIRRKAGKSATA